MLWSAASQGVARPYVVISIYPTVRYFIDITLILQEGELFDLG